MKLLRFSTVFVLITPLVLIRGLCSMYDYIYPPITSEDFIKDSFDRFIDKYVEWVKHGKARKKG